MYESRKSPQSVIIKLIIALRLILVGQLKIYTLYDMRNETP